MYTLAYHLEGLDCQEDYYDDDHEDDHDVGDNDDKEPVWVGFAGSPNDSLVAGRHVHPVQVCLGAARDNHHRQGQQDEDDGDGGGDGDQGTCSSQENFAGKQVSASSPAVAVEIPAIIII